MVYFYEAVQVEAYVSMDRRRDFFIELMIN